MRGPRRAGHDRWLHVRIGLFFVAAFFLLISMVLDDRRYAIPAIAVAVAALAMRFLPTDEEDGVGE